MTAVLVGNNMNTAHGRLNITNSWNRNIVSAAVTLSPSKCTKPSSTELQNSDDVDACKLRITVDDYVAKDMIELWYPHNLGNQPLYNYTATLYFPESPDIP